MKDRTTRPHRVAVLAIALSAALMQAGGSIAQAPAPQGSGATITVTHQSSLWNLVRPHVPKGATTMQALLAFVRLNPDAFEGGNLNRLRMGAVLQIPTSEQILAEDSKLAAQMYARHEAAWQRSQPTPPLYPLPTGAAAQPDTSAAAAPPATAAPPAAPTAPATPASSPVAASPAAAPSTPPAATPDAKPGKPAEAGSTWLSGLGWFSVYALFAVGAWLALKPKRRKSGAADSSGDTTIHVPDTEMDAPTVVAPPVATTATASQTTQNRDGHGGSSSKRKRHAKEHKTGRDDGKAKDTVIAAAAATASLNTEPGGTSTLMAQVAEPVAAPAAPVIAQPVEPLVPAPVAVAPVKQVPDEVPATPVISAPVIEPPAQTPQEFDAEALSMPYLPAQTAAFGLGNAPGATTRQIVVRQGEAPRRDTITDPLELRIAQALIQAYDEIGRSDQAQRIRATLPS